jgi:hypothetical protein
MNPVPYYSLLLYIVLKPLSYFNIYLNMNNIIFKIISRKIHEVKSYTNFEFVINSDQASVAGYGILNLIIISFLVTK